MTWELPSVVEESSPFFPVASQVLVKVSPLALVVTSGRPLLSNVWLVACALSSVALVVRLSAL